MTPEAAAAERVARESYGRLLALLAARTRDVAAAEDALAEAFAAALSAWPRAGLPEKPEAWLLAAARRKLIDSARRAATAAKGEHQVQLTIEELASQADVNTVPDHRLGLMFACAHPDIDIAARTPLMLQVVLGFSAERIAQAFMIEPATISQRLVRAKKRIKDAPLSFEIPSPDLWADRFAAVLEAVYAAYAAGWSAPIGADPRRHDLAGEGLWLARVLVGQLPEEPEARGLLALLLHLEARKNARRDAAGAYVPLDEQNLALWNVDMQGEAENLLRAASRMARPGRFQLEAAIQSAHAARAWRGHADWPAIIVLYEALADITGSPVAYLNHAAALARRDGAEAGIAAVDAVRTRVPTLEDYQPYWALRADLLAKLENASEARAAYDEACARETDPAIVSFLKHRRSLLP